MATNLIKITLNGRGGELDSRIAFFGTCEADDDTQITRAVIDLVKHSLLAVGDTITIEEIVQG